jgi:hypothetical protein
MPPVRLKPNRTGTYLSLGFGVVCVILGLALLAAGTLVGIFPLVLAAIGIYGGIGGLVPGVGLFLDGQGFRLKSFGKSWSAQWLEIAGFTPTKVRVGRRSGDVEVVEIHYQPGVGDRHLPGSKLGETLGVDERYLIAAYGGLSNEALAALLERYRVGG